MAVPHVLQFCIALFTGTVIATFAPPVRRSIPRWVEVTLWVALIVVCVMGVMSVKEPRARELTGSLAWAADHIINTVVGLTGAGVVGWLAEHRFAIADGAVVLFAIDVLVVAMMRSWRAGQASLPQAHLMEWFELPSRAAMVAKPAVPYAVDELSRKLERGLATAGAHALILLIQVSTWLRDVGVPRERVRLARVIAAGRVDSHAGLDALHERASLLQFAARSWYTVAGVPVVNGVGAKTAGAVRSVAPALRARSAAGITPRRVAEIRALLGAQSIGWYGLLGTTPPAPDPGDDNGTQEQIDRLAS